MRFIDCRAVRGPSSFLFKSLDFVFSFLCGLGFFLFHVSPATTARQNRAPPRSILPPTRPGGGPERSGLSHYPGWGWRMCVSVSGRGAAAGLFRSPPPAPHLSSWRRPAGRRSGRGRSVPAGDAKGLSGKAAALPRLCFTAHLSCPRLPVPHHPAQLPSPASPSPPGSPSPPASALLTRFCLQPSVPRIPRAMSFRQRSPHGSTKSR